MADVTSFIGSTMGLVAVTRDPDLNAAGYGALTFATIGNIVSIGALGDTSASIPINILAESRTIYVNGERTLGEITVTVAIDVEDAQQLAIAAAANTNANYAFEVTDQDGEIYYFQGLLANWQTTERNTSSYKGATFTIRGNTAIVIVPAP